MAPHTTPSTTTPSTTTPSTVEGPSLDRREQLIFVCHGCTIVLREVTELHNKIEYQGPGYCLGCEFRMQDGYIMNREITEEIERAREWIKKDDFWRKSREEADRRTDLRILEIELELSRQTRADMEEMERELELAREAGQIE